MKLTVNGRPAECASAAPTVRTILDELRFSFPLLNVRLNGNLVQRADYANTTVSEGDDLDVYHLVSGG